MFKLLDTVILSYLIIVIKSTYFIQLLCLRLILLDMNPNLLPNSIEINHISGFRSSHKNSLYPFMDFIIHYTISIIFSYSLLLYSLHIKTRIKLKLLISMGRREYYLSMLLVLQSYFCCILPPSTIKCLISPFSSVPQ